MGTLIGISNPQKQLRQNHNFLAFLGGGSIILGLFMWSAPPFIWSNNKYKTGIVFRYLTLTSSLICGITAIATGNQLQKIAPLVKAIEAAEKNDFFTQLAASQYAQQQHWEMLGSQPPTLPQHYPPQYPQSSAAAAAEPPSQPAALDTYDSQAFAAMSGTAVADSGTVAVAGTDARAERLQIVAKMLKNKRSKAEMIERLWNVDESHPEYNYYQQMLESMLLEIKGDVDK